MQYEIHQAGGSQRAVDTLRDYTHGVQQAKV